MKRIFGQRTSGAPKTNRFTSTERKTVSEKDAWASVLRPAPKGSELNTSLNSPSATFIKTSLLKYINPRRITYASGRRSSLKDAKDLSSTKRDNTISDQIEHDYFIIPSREDSTDPELTSFKKQTLSPLRDSGTKLASRPATPPKPGHSTKVERNIPSRPGPPTPPKPGHSTKVKRNIPSRPAPPRPDGKP